MTANVLVTRRGHRRVEQISLCGRPYFLVTDPRYAFQSPGTLGYVPLLTRTAEVNGQQVTVFSQVTVNGLKVLGVELDELTAGDIEITRKPKPVLPRVAPGKRYGVFLSRFLADVSAVKGES